MITVGTGRVVEDRLGIFVGDHCVAEWFLWDGLLARGYAFIWDWQRSWLAWLLVFV